MQQDHRIGRQRTGCRERFGGVPGRFAAAAITIGIVEKSQPEFHGEHLRAEFVDLPDADPALCDQLFHVFEITVPDHIHVDAGFDGQPCGVFQVFGDAVVDHLVDGGVVGDDESVEAQLPAQQVGHQVAASRRRNGVVVVERGHDRCRSGVQRGPVGREIDLAERAFGHVYRVVVAPCLRGAVGGEMFYAGHDGRRVGEVRSLIAPDHGGCDVLSQIGVFARTLRNATPAGIARDVAHR